jgi:hypothetical protein
MIAHMRYDQSQFELSLRKTEMNQIALCCKCQEIRHVCVQKIQKIYTWTQTPLICTQII